jgi:hypothetical protein
MWKHQYWVGAQARASRQRQEPAGLERAYHYHHQRGLVRSRSTHLAASPRQQQVSLA